MDPQDQKELLSPSWPPPARTFALVLITAALIWLAVLIMPLLQAVVIAVLLALLFNPLVHWVMRRLRLERTWAVVVVFATSLILLLGISIGLGSLAVTQVNNLGTEFSAAIAELEGWVLQPIDFFGYHVEPASMLVNLETNIASTLAILPRGSLNLLSNVTTNLLWTLTIFVTLYYLLKDGPRIGPWFLDHVPADYQPEISILLDQMEEIWGRFLRIQIVLFIVLIVLLILGTLLVIWLFRSGLVRWSPVGFVLLLLLVYTAVQQIDNLWLRPQYMGRYLQLHPGLLFVGLIAGLVFGGLLGALVVVPAIATARIVGRYLFNKIMGRPPWPEAQST